MKEARTHKEEILILVAAGLLLLGAAVRAHAYPRYGQPGGSVEAAISTDVIYAELEGYGEWRFVPSIGVRLWFPFMEIGWRPYTYGHWVHTYDGLTWVAYEPWGYVPHHYGRWIYVEPYGWGWAMGYEYGPAWVTWGVATGHIGWAPLPPVWYHYPHRVAYHSPPPLVDYGYGGYYHYPTFGISFDLWVFVPDIHFYGSNISIHVLSRDRCSHFFHSRRVLPVGHHLNINYVRKKTHHAIVTVDIDRVPSRAGRSSYVRHVPRGQEKMIREAEPEVNRLLLPVAREARSGSRLTGEAPKASDAARVQSTGRSRSAQPATESTRARSAERYEKKAPSQASREKIAAPKKEQKQAPAPSSASSRREVSSKKSRSSESPESKRSGGSRSGGASRSSGAKKKR